MKLREFLQQDAQAEQPLLVPVSHRMASVLADVEIPGTRRKVGPSLRHVAEKLGSEFLFRWIRRPQDFRPTTRMPQFFGLWDHLHAEPAELAKSKRLEPVEILGITTYLLDKSQPLSVARNDTDQAPPADQQQIARGKLLFQMRGCLACHQHTDFPGHDATQGPDLTNLGVKLAAAKGSGGRQWLYNWLKSPSTYSPRTKMPQIPLDAVTDEKGNTTDPAADIVAYLLAGGGDAASSDDADDTTQLLQQPDPQSVNELALEHLQSAFHRKKAEEYLERGIPMAMRDSLKGAEIELVGPPRDAQDAQHRKLLYIGSKSIGKAGCFACHDIPGFEDAKPIGTALADWGRKDPTRLAFEHISQYVHGSSDHVSSPISPESGSAASFVAQSLQSRAAPASFVARSLQSRARGQLRSPISPESGSRPAS